MSIRQIKPFVSLKNIGFGLLVIVFLLVSVILFYHLEGNEIFVVRSDSMSPAINKYDIVIVQSIPFHEISGNDVIAFDSHLEGFGIIVHRVISTGTGQINGLVTMGDNAKNVDPWVVDEHAYVGKVVKIMPLIGVFWVAPFNYMTIGVSVFVIVLIIKKQNYF